MGNHCNCFNNMINNIDANLSNQSKSQKILNNRQSNNSVNTNLPDSINSNSVKKNLFHLKKSKNNSNIKLVNININAKQNNHQPKKNLSEKKIILISSNIKGFLLRKKYKKYLREELTNYSIELYKEYLKKTKNQKVSEILNSSDPQIIKYLNTPWTDFYPENPTIETIKKIKNTKKYPGGLIFKYNTQNFNFSNISECIKSAEYCYKGEVNLYNNKKCGNGEIIFADGGKKEGTFFNDNFEGWNKYIDNEGILFVGLFKNGLLNGKGLKFSKDINHIYMGDFINNLRNGFGKDYRNAYKYEGMFNNDKKCGKGKIEFENGDTYEGDFKDNKFNGYGNFKWKKNGHEYKGNYLDGKFHGFGYYKLGGKEYYKGEYKNGIKDGKGEICKADGTKFYAVFKNGKPDGIGTFEDKDGMTCQVEFVQGKLNKKFNN